MNQLTVIVVSIVQVYYVIRCSRDVRLVGYGTIEVY